MLRGSLIRKKYENKLINIKNKQNLNKNENNKIDILQDLENKSLIIQKMLRGSLIRKKYENKLTNIKKKKTNKNKDLNKNKRLKNNESSSLRSEISKISINSDDLNFSDEEDESENDIKELDLPSDTD